jgi:hypothetical protein
MTTFQWQNPTEEQIAQANELAARIGVQPYWSGDILCVDEPDPEPTPEDETG